MKPDGLLMLLFGVLAAVSATVGVTALAYGAGAMSAGAFGASVFFVVILLFESGEAEIGEPEVRLQYWRCVACGERHELARMIEQDGLRCPACADSGLGAPSEPRR